jgi:FkbM family methyltransferase
MLDSDGPDERISQIKCLQCAVSDVTGTIPFYQTGYTAGSSTEPLDKQAGAWDKVFPRRGSWYRRLRGYLRKLRALRTRVFQVPSRTLDDVLSSLEPDWGEFTYLRMNIQGAELRALRGAQRTLRNIDIVDFDRIVAPRYGGTGAAPQETYDELMSSFGFERVVTIDFEVDWRVVYRRLTGGVTP